MRLTAHPIRTHPVVTGWSLMIACFALLAQGCATFDKTTVSGGAVYRSDRTRVAVVFNDHDRGVIRDYYHHRRASLPPGLAKKKQLPPGLRKQVERNGHLPPGLEGQRLPRDLETRLAGLEDGYVRVRVGADIVLMERDTRLVMDVVKDVAL